MALIVDDPQIVELELLIQNDIEKLHNMNSERPCIFKIPQDIREVSPGAYTPSVVAIGPYHAEEEKLKSMECQKLKCLASLMLRNRDRSLKDYITTIKERESEAQRCYSGIEDLKLDSQKFIRMLLLDGAFIVEFFCMMVEESRSDDRDEEYNEYLSNIKADIISGSSSNSDEPKDNILSTQMDIYSDLVLLENQVPFFILEALFDCTFSGKNSTFIELAYINLKEWIPVMPDKQCLSRNELIKRSSKENTMHLVHFMRMCCLDHVHVQQNHSNTLSSPTHSPLRKFCCSYIDRWREKRRQQQQQPIRQFISATELHEAGVRFKSWENGPSIDFNFDEDNGVVEMPNLLLSGGTETFFRNIIAYEVCYLHKYEVTCFMDFMDGLIDTPKDVHILEESHLIDNWLESKERVATIFNTITKSTLVSRDQKHVELSEKLTSYIMKPWNKWVAILFRDYFGSPWTIISFIAAVLLIGLTLVQTIASVRSTNWH